MSKNIEVAKTVVVSYFENLASKDTLNFTGFQALLDLKFDEDNKVLLEHLKALVKIFNDAIKDIEGGDK